MKSIRLIFLLLCGFLPVVADAQTLHTSSARAARFYRDGSQSYDFFDYTSAETNLRLAIQTDPRFYEAHMVLAELFAKQKRFSESARHYQEAVRIDSLYFPPVLFQLANSELMSGNYEKALVHYSAYLEQKDISVKNSALARKNILNCEFAIEALKHPVEFSPVDMGKGINTSDDEYWPSITADGLTMMFTRQGKPAERGMSRVPAQEDFYLSFFGQDGWSEAVNAGPPLNSPANEGAQTLSSDGTYMYFTACDRPGGAGSCDIYFSSFSSGKWSIPFNIGPPVNTVHWESQPSVIANGRLLFFSGNRPGGAGGKDLWYSVKKSNNSWSDPVNMGSVINTDGDEMSPFIHFDGRTLYFSSDGRPGMGGFDIYMTKMNDDSTWSEPRNLGYPINTYNDETGLVIESGGQRAYFSSVRDNVGRKDVFWFNLEESIRPDPVSYLKGRVVDQGTGLALQADYELIEISSQAILVESSTDQNGNFLVCLPAGKNYGLNVRKTGYLFYSGSFMLEGEHSAATPYIKQIALNPVRAGEKMLLSNVFFEVDSWLLKKESLAELNNLVDMLGENVNIVVEIGGYTDSTGTDQHNMVLSGKRAQSVVDYLVSRGIEVDRLKPKGYGNSFPVGDNVTTEGRRLNRRTEVKILED